MFLGGVTTARTDRPLTWGKDVVTTLAGPAFGVSLGLLCMGLLPRATSPLAAYTLSIGAGTNLVWAAFNLLPVLPMDEAGSAGPSLAGCSVARGCSPRTCSGWWAAG